METYNGVFIASTNRLEELDQASLRRFDLKIKFDPLKPKQAWKLLLNYCKALGLKAPQKYLEQELYKMDNLTPGDFALLARQHRFKPMADAKELIHALQAECKLKTPYKSQSIGFV
jgi:SpoVK/Ycf46/Vps4 family AAA+-type ATPase